MKKVEHLISVNDRGNVRIITVNLEYNIKKFSITKESYQYGCKHTFRHLTTNEVAFCNRSIVEQAEFEFNQVIKNHCSKGYKKLSSLTRKKIENLSESDLIKLYGPTRTFKDNFPKPMMATYYFKCSNSVFNQDQYCMPILNGKRCFVYLKNSNIEIRSIDNEIITDKYDFITLENTQHLFKNDPNIIYDCIIIKNTCVITDFVSDLPFVERLDMLKHLSFYDNLNIVTIQYTLSNGWYYINKLYKQYLSNGHLGLIMKDPQKGYAYGRKSSLYMVKMVEQNTQTEY